MPVVWWFSGWSTSNVGVFFSYILLLALLTCKFPKLTLRIAFVGNIIITWGPHTWSPVTSSESLCGQIAREALCWQLKKVASLCRCFPLSLFQYALDSVGQDDPMCRFVTPCIREIKALIGPCVTCSICDSNFKYFFKSCMCNTLQYIAIKRPVHHMIQEHCSSHAGLFLNIQ